MKSRISVARFLNRLGGFIQSLAIVVMKPDDLIEYSRQSYRRNQNMELWIRDDVVDSGLTEYENTLLDYVPLRKGRILLLGVGGGFYLPSGVATITALVKPRHWGMALAVHELAPVLAFISSPLASELLLRYFSWRGVVSIVGIGSLMAGMTFVLFGRGGEYPGEQPNLKSAKLLFSEPSFWIMAALFCLAVSSTIGIYFMIPLYLVVDHGLDQSFVNFCHDVGRIFLTLNTQVPSPIPSPMLMLRDHSNITRDR